MAGMRGDRETWIRTAGTVLLLVLTALAVWRLRVLLTTVLLALVCAYVLRPLVQGLCRIAVRVGSRDYRLPRGVATGLIFLLLAVIVWLIWQLSAPSLGRQVDELQARWPRLWSRVVNTVHDCDRYYRERMPPFLRPTVDSWIDELPGILATTARKGLGLTWHGVGLLVELLLVPILAFYFLADGPAIRHQVLFFVPPRYLRRTAQTLDLADDVFQRYIKGQVILCLIAFAAVTIGLWAINVDFYLLLGLIAGLTRAIPIIGPVVGAVPILIVVVLTTNSAALTLWVLLLFTLMHLLESKLLMPAILGQQLELHPVLIIVALLVGAQMGGLLGLFLAAPVLAVVRTIVARRRSPESYPA
jgi:predicted PurR-regulated permease PerM